MTRKELISSPVYWITQFQIEIFRAVRDAWEKSKKSDIQFATQLGISKYKLNQIMAGDWVGSVKEYCEIMVKLKKAPVIKIENLKDVK